MIGYILSMIVTHLLRRTLKLRSFSSSVDWQTGDITITNLDLDVDRLNKSLFPSQQSHLIFAGTATITKVAAHFPWWALYSMPVTVTIEGVHLTVDHNTAPLVAPSPPGKQSRRRPQRKDEEAISAIQRRGFFMRIMDTIVANAQITFKDVEIKTVCGLSVEVKEASIFPADPTFSAAVFDPEANENYPSQPRRKLVMKGLRACNIIDTACAEVNATSLSDISIVTPAPGVVITLSMARYMPLRRFLHILEWRARRVSLAYLLPPHNTAIRRMQYATRAIIRDLRAFKARCRYQWSHNFRTDPVPTPLPLHLRVKLHFSGLLSGSVLIAHKPDGNLSVIALGFGVQDLLTVKRLTVHFNSDPTVDRLLLRASGLTILDTSPYVYAMHHIYPLSLQHMPSIRFDRFTPDPPHFETLEEALANIQSRRLPMKCNIELDEDACGYLFFDEINTFRVYCQKVHISFDYDPSELYTGCVVNIPYGDVYHSLGHLGPSRVANPEWELLGTVHNIVGPVTWFQPPPKMMTKFPGHFPQLCPLQAEKLDLNIHPEMFGSLIGGLWHLCYQIWYPFGLAREVLFEDEDVVAHVVAGDSVVHKMVHCKMLADREWKRVTFTPLDGTQPFRFNLDYLCTWEQRGAEEIVVSFPNYNCGSVALTLSNPSGGMTPLRTFIAWCCAQHGPENDSPLVQRRISCSVKGWTAKFAAADHTNFCRLSTDYAHLDFDIYERYPVIHLCSTAITFQCPNHFARFSDMDFYYRYYYYKFLPHPEPMSVLDIKVREKAEFEFELDLFPQLTAIVFDLLQVLWYQEEVSTRKFPALAGWYPFVKTIDKQTMKMDAMNASIKVSSKRFCTHRPEGHITTFVCKPGERMVVTRTTVAEADTMTMTVGKFSSSILTSDAWFMEYYRPILTCADTSIRGDAHIAVNSSQITKVTLDSNDWNNMNRMIRWMDFWELARPEPKTAVYAACQEEYDRTVAVLEKWHPMIYTYTLSRTNLHMTWPGPGLPIDTNFTDFEMTYVTTGSMRVTFAEMSSNTPCTMRGYYFLWQWLDEDKKPIKRYTVTLDELRLHCTAELYKAYNDTLDAHWWPLRFDPYVIPYWFVPSAVVREGYISFSIEHSVFHICDFTTMTFTAGHGQRMTTDLYDGKQHVVHLFDMKKCVGTDANDDVFLLYPTKNHNDPTPAERLRFSVHDRLWSAPSVNPTSLTFYCDLQQGRLDFTPTFVQDMVKCYSDPKEECIRYNTQPIESSLKSVRESTQSLDSLSKSQTVSSEKMLASGRIPRKMPDTIISTPIYNVTDPMEVSHSNRILIQCHSTICGPSTLSLIGDCDPGDTPEDFRYAMIVKGNATLRFENITLMSQHQVQKYIYLERGAKLEFASSVTFIVRDSGHGAPVEHLDIVVTCGDVAFGLCTDSAPSRLKLFCNVSGKVSNQREEVRTCKKMDLTTFSMHRTTGEPTCNPVVLIPPMPLHISQTTEGDARVLTMTLEEGQMNVEGGDIVALQEWFTKVKAQVPESEAPTPSPQPYHTTFKGTIRCLDIRLLTNTDTSSEPFLGMKVSNMVCSDQKDGTTMSLFFQRYDKVIHRWEPITDRCDLQIVSANYSTTLRSLSTIEVSLTPEIIKTLTIRITKWLQPSEMGDTKNSYYQSESSSGITLRNHTGLTLPLLVKSQKQGRTERHLIPSFNTAEFPGDDSGFAIECGNLGLKPIDLFTLADQQIFFQGEFITIATKVDTVLENHKILTFLSSWRVHNMCGFVVHARLGQTHIALPSHAIHSIPYVLSPNLEDKATSPTCSLTLRPLLVRENEKTYSWSEAVVWPVQTSHIVACPRAGGGAFYLHVSTQVTKLSSGATIRTLILLPTMYVRNRLTVPFEVAVRYDDDGTGSVIQRELQPGAAAMLNEINTDRKCAISLRLMDDCQKQSSPTWVTLENDEIVALKVSPTRTVLALVIWYSGAETSESFCDVTVYVPYWLINDTPWPALKFLDEDQKEVVDSQMFCPQRAWGRLCVKMGDAGTPSQSFNYDVVGADESIVCEYNNKKYFVAVNVSVAQGVFSRTKIVRLMAQYYVKNDHKLPLRLFSKKEKKLIFSLDVGEIAPLVIPAEFPTESLNSILITFADFATASERVSLNQIQFSKHRIVDPINKTETVFSLHISQYENTVSILLEIPTVPPFFIVNRTFHEVFLKDNYVTVPPYSLQPLYPLGSDVTTIDVTIPSVGFQDSVKLSLDLGANAPRGHPAGFRCRTVVGRDCLVLLVSQDLDDEKNLDAVGKDVKTFPAASPCTILNISLGLSLVDAGREIAYFTLQNLVVQRVMRAKDDYDLRVTLGSLQLDNTLPLPLYDVVVCPGRIDAPSVHSKITEDSRVIDISIDGFSGASSQQIHQIRRIDIKLGEVSLRLEDSWMVRVHRFLEKANYFSDAIQIKEEKVETVYLYVEELNLHSSSIHFSYIADSDMQTSSSNPFLLLIKTMGSAVQHIEDAQLGFSSLQLRRVYGVRSEVTKTLQKHIRRGVLIGFYKALGALEVIGNPIGLLGNVRDGVSDVFTEFGVGSLGRNVVFGTAGVAKGITKGLGTGLARLSFDDEYVRVRRSKKAQKPKNFGEGALDGVKALGTGLGQGISGIVMKPITGASEEGVGGFFKGIGIGLVGAVAKPVTGVLDLVSHTTEGLQATVVDGSTVRQRVRSPRVLLGSKLEPYDEERAKFGLLLSSLCDGKYAEDVLEHCVVGAPFLFLFTDLNIFQVDIAANFLLLRFRYKYITHCVFLSETQIDFRVLLKHSNAPQVVTAKTFDGAQSRALLLHISQKRPDLLLENFTVIPYSPSLPPITKNDAVVHSAPHINDFDVLPQSSTMFPLLEPQPSLGVGSRERQVALLYEHERYYVLGGWSTLLMLHDPPHWSHPGPPLVSMTRTEYSLPPGWEWVGDWMIEGKNSEETDADGYQYAFDFWSAFTAKSTVAYVRRRRWTRTMQPLIQ